MKKKILITTKGAFIAKNSIKNIFSENYEYIFTNKIVIDKDELKSLLSDVSAVIIGSEILDSEILSAANKLEIIVRFGGGFSNIDLNYAAKNKIKVQEIKCDEVSKDTSILAFGLFVAYLFNFKKHFNEADRDIWERRANISTAGSIGIIGSGKVALSLAAGLRSFGFQVKYWSRNSKNTFDKIGCFYSKSISNLINDSFGIFLAISLTPETKNIINSDFLRKMKGKILINTSRGDLVSEKDILEALDNGYLDAYLTDVTSKEPPSELSLELRRHRKVISTPHIGGYSINNLIKVLESGLKFIHIQFNS